MCSKLAQEVYCSTLLLSLMALGGMTQGFGDFLFLLGGGWGYSSGAGYRAGASPRFRSVCKSY